MGKKKVLQKQKKLFRRKKADHVSTVEPTAVKSEQPEAPEPTVISDKQVIEAPAVDPDAEQSGEEGFLAKVKAKGAAFRGISSKKKMYFVLPILLLLGLVMHFLSGNGDSNLTSSGTDWSICAVVATLIYLLVFCYFAKGMCCGPPKNHVWSKNSEAYVPRQGPVALTTTEGGIGLGGWLLILLVVGGIYGYFRMEKQTLQEPLIPLYGPGKGPPPRQWPPPRKY